MKKYIFYDDNNLAITSEQGNDLHYADDSKSFIVSKNGEMVLLVSSESIRAIRVEEVEK